MKKTQKFKRGNLVEVLIGHEVFSYENGERKVTDIGTEQIGKTAIIEYSYNDKFGGGGTEEYSIIFTDTGNSLAWKYPSELKLIDNGGEYLFKEARKNRERISKQNKNIDFILSGLDEGAFNSESILFLFDMIGYNSAFYRNGEFFSLFSEWSELHPVFKHIKNAKTLEEAQSIFTPKGLRYFNIKKVYDTFHKQE